MAESTEVIHHPKQTHFVVQIGSDIAHLDYTLKGSVIDMHHPVVPPALRGKNIAGQLAKAAFDFAREQQLQVIPSCSYIARYAERYPEAGKLIDKS